MRGRKPKRAARKISEGDPRKQGIHKLEQERDAEPKATSGLPSCPRHLKGRARFAWNFWSEELAAMGIDKRPDGPALEGICRAYERAVKADLILDAQGLTFEEKYVDEATGEVHILKIRKHPAVEISNRSWLLVKAFCVEFGLTPVSRTRLAIPRDGSNAEDELTALLSGPRVPAAAGSDKVQ